METIYHSLTALVGFKVIMPSFPYDITICELTTVTTSILMHVLAGAHRVTDFSIIKIYLF